LEPEFYNPDFRKTFNGVVSICPKSFPTFITKLFESNLEWAKLFINHNTEWVRKMLSDWEEGWKYYEKGKEDRYIGPADVLLAFIYSRPNHHRSEYITRKFQDKDGVFNNDEFSYYTVKSINYEKFEEFLIESLK